jgi:hypothetical protein
MSIVLEKVLLILDEIRKPNDRESALQNDVIVDGE